MGGRGVAYHANWVGPARARWFHVMAAPDRTLLDTRASRWNDLVDFEMVPVLSGAEFWAQAQPCE